MGYFICSINYSFSKLLVTCSGQQIVIFYMDLRKDVYCSDWGITILIKLEVSNYKLDDHRLQLYEVLKETHHLFFGLM